ncbi:MAG: PAS domain-containing sensor histidine kinase [Candidatus Binatia bacterium]
MRTIGQPPVPTARMSEQAGGDEHTDHRAVADALDRQRAELRLILDAVPALIWFKDCDNRILRANRRVAESLGLDVEAIEGRPTAELYPEEAAQYHRDDLEVIRSGEAKLGIVEQMMTGNGEKRWVRTDKVPYRDAQGTVIGVIVFAVDVTERVQAEIALREAHDELEARVEQRTRQLASAVDDLRAEIADRRRAEERVLEQQSQLAHLQRVRTVEGMAAQLAHEINQPLAAIVNFASGLARWLRSGTVDMAAMQDATDQISQQALRAAGVVRRLRDFVRKDEAQSYAPCDLAEVVAEAARLIEFDAHRRGVAIHLQVEAALPPVAIDRVQIEQVVINLLNNALEAMSELPSAGAVVIETRRHDATHLEVRISDSGRGLPAGAVAVLFEPYFTTKADGLGMGLPISEAIVIAHGGRLAAEPGPHGGAVFSVILPCSP